jgi:hypothetical protein
MKYMQRRIIGSYYKKDNHIFNICISFFILMLVLLFSTVFIKVINVYQSYNEFGMPLNEVIYSISGIILIWTLYYLLNIIVNKKEIYRLRNIFIKFIMFTIYICLTFPLLFVVTNNVMIIVLFISVILISFFLIPRLKYNSRQSFDEKKLDATKSDYILTIISCILLLTSLLDYFINKRDLLYNNITGTPGFLIIYCYLILVFIFFPKYSSMLWLNLYFRKDAYTKEIEKIVKLDENFNEDVKILNAKQIIFSHNDIKFVYENDNHITYDESWLSHSFYDESGKIIKYDVININNINKRVVQVKYKIITDSFKSYISLYKTKATNRVFAVKVGKNIYESKYTPSTLELIFDFSIYTLLCIASLNIFSFLVFAFVQFLLLNRIFYFGKLYRLLIKIAIILFFILIIV